MTVRKRAEWGDRGPLPDEGVLVHDDRQAALVLMEARAAKRPLPPLGLLGGDLCRTLGGSGDAERLASQDAQRLPVDLGIALVDGRVELFVAHVVIRRRFWGGPVRVAMNAQFIGDWDVAPRGHPNDGRLDVFEAELGFDDRLKVRRRLPSGTHLPHPAIGAARASATQWEVPTGAKVRCDGVPVEGSGSVTLRVEPDAILCVV